MRITVTFEGVSAFGRKKKMNDPAQEEIIHPNP
jgi:hypothetical protein